MGCTGNVPPGGTSCTAPPPQGNIEVDATANDGHGTVNFLPGAAPPNSQFTLRFCPAFGNGQNCFDVAPVSVGANGGGSTGFTFPQKGTFSGNFWVTSGGVNVFNTGAASQVSGVSFAATLLPIKTITGSGFGGPGTGTVVASSGTSITFTLSGALASHTYTAGRCGGTICSGATLMTDANGNGTVTFARSQLGIGTAGFGIRDSSGIAFLEGFIVQ